MCLHNKAVIRQLVPFSTNPVPYPLIPDAATPSTKYFWKQRYKISSGRIVTTAIAIIGPMSIVEPDSPLKAFSPSAIVNLAGLPK